MSPFCRGLQGSRNNGLLIATSHASVIHELGRQVRVERMTYPHFVVPFTGVTIVRYWVVSDSLIHAYRISDTSRNLLALPYFSGLCYELSMYDCFDDLWLCCPPCTQEAR